MASEPTTPEDSPADGLDPGELNPRSSPSRALGRRRRTWKQRTALSVGVVVSVMAVTAAAVFGYGTWKLRSIDRTSVALDDVASGGPRNYLIVGSDTRASGDPNDPAAKVDHQPLADTIMVLRVDPSTQTARMLSLPRDLWVHIAGTEKEGRINAAYAAGPQNLIDTLRAELDIPINHYLEVDFHGFQEVVSAIGGVPMWFDRAMRDNNSGLDVLHPGCTTLDGYGALAFARARHLQYWEQGGFRYDGTGDLGRISRQQIFLRRVISRAKSKGLQNPLTLKRLVDVGAANVTIDDSLKVRELLSLAKRFNDFDPDELLTYTLPTSPRTTSGGAKVEDLDTAAAQPLLDMFRDSPQPGSEADPSTSTSTTELTLEMLAKPASVSVQVFNSAGRDGLAVDAADRLVALGFEVPKWGNGVDAGHESESHSVVRFGAGPEAETQARTVASWVASGADVVSDPTLADGTVALFLGQDFSELAKPTAVAPAPATDDGGQVGGSAPGTSTPESTTVPTTTTTTIPPSSEVVGMVPPGDPPPGRECG